MKWLTTFEWSILAALGSYVSGELGILLFRLTPRAHFMLSAHPGEAHHRPISKQELQTRQVCNILLFIMCESDEQV
jgi:hypothetical protein